MPSFAGRALVGLVRCYQALSPLLPPVCRFHPTCSEYMVQAIRIHGVLRGVGLGLLRVLRCHPFHPGGLDAVPPKKEKPRRS